MKSHPKKYNAGSCVGGSGGTSTLWRFPIPKSWTDTFLSSLSILTVAEWSNCILSDNASQGVLVQHEFPLIKLHESTKTFCPSPPPCSPAVSFHLVHPKVTNADTMSQEQFAY